MFKKYNSLSFIIQEWIDYIIPIQGLWKEIHQFVYLIYIWGTFIHGKEILQIQVPIAGMFTYWLSDLSLSCRWSTVKEY